MGIALEDGPHCRVSGGQILDHKISTRGPERRRYTIIRRLQFLLDFEVLLDPLQAGDIKNMRRSEVPISYLLPEETLREIIGHSDQTKSKAHHGFRTD